MMTFLLHGLPVIAELQGLPATPVMSFQLNIALELAAKGLHPGRKVVWVRAGLTFQSLMGQRDKMCVLTLGSSRQVHGHMADRIFCNK